jgi:hypothetical protein
MAAPAPSLFRTLGHGSQAASYVLGALAIGTAAVSALLAVEPADIAAWTLDVLGVGFVALLGVLVLAAAYALVRLHAAPAAAEAEGRLWLQVGLQASAGVATLALTFTLLGISLGIGGLAGQELTPETVQPVIRDLTANFSLAFMTTVIGLPLSAGLRAATLIAFEKRRADHAAPHTGDPS